MVADVGVLRLASTILNRMKLRGSGLFGGKRNTYEALGYVDNPTLYDYELRYDRGDIAARIVEVHAKATWTAGIEIIETETPDKYTLFEKRVALLAEKLNLWSVLLRADILSGIGEYSVVLIGAPGSLDQPLPDGKRDINRLLYLTPVRQSNASIEKYVEDTRNPRFGQPEYYQLSNLVPGSAITRRVHHSRILHVAEATGDSLVKAAPRLKKVFNRLDDLDKIVGGGSEAFWKSVYQGMQLDVDPEVDFDEDQKNELSKQVDEFEHNMRRVFRTRGVTVNTLGVEVADFSPQAYTIIDLICGTIEVPKRIFLGSERGELASSQDQESWESTIAQRRANFAWPLVVKPLIQRLIDYNYLPKPATGEFRVSWPERNELSNKDKAVVAQRLATVNKMMGMPVFSDGDIRDKVMGWDLLTDEEKKKIPIPGGSTVRENGPPPDGQDERTKEVGGDVLKPAE